jgi:hypothetical protein
MAYRRRDLPPSPEKDPDGWKQLLPVSIQGTLGDQTALTVRYTLFLAMPVSFETFNRGIYLILKGDSYPTFEAT